MMKSIIKSVPLLFAIHCFLSCGGDSSESSASRIGPAGGTVKGADGVTLEIPEGALDKDVEFAISKQAAPSGVPFIALDSAYDIGPSGTKFLKPVTVYLPYDSSELPVGKTEEDLRIYTANSSTGPWISLETTATGGKARAVITHLSVFANGVEDDTIDSGVFDTGMADTAAPDAGIVDGIVPDASYEDVVSPDASKSDVQTGMDIAVDLPIGDLAKDTSASDATADMPVSDATADMPVSDATVDMPVPDATVDMPVPDATVDMSLADIAAVTPATWIAISVGTFTMGSPPTEPCRSYQEDQHQVTLTHDFEIQSTETTQAQFQDAMGYNPSDYGPNGTLGICGDNCPVERLTWYEAAAYCNALSSQAGLDQCYSCSGSGEGVTCSEAPAYNDGNVYHCPGYRLPTEAEWEFAYRAGSITALYPSPGNDGSISVCFGSADANADKIAWYYYNSNMKTHPVAQLAPNAWGLYDMAGNAQEWCHDRWLDYLGTAPVTDPWGAASETLRSHRGFSLTGQPAFLRGAIRGSVGPSFKGVMGVRCVRTLSP